jgi:hypothetical protein
MDMLHHGECAVGEIAEKLIPSHLNQENVDVEITD